MSPASGNTPPEFGAADLRVDPQALWDVGLALQRVRDSLAGFHEAIWREGAGLAETWVPEALPEIWQAWRQISMVTTGPPNGLTKQVEGLIGVLDNTMISLRDVIVAYVVSETESQRRLQRLEQ